MSKQEADRLADALRQSFPAYGDGTRSDRERLAIDAAALLDRWPDGEPVHQFRSIFSADWYDGHPDANDNCGPHEPRTLYETRTLYTAPPDQSARIAELEAALRFYASGDHFDHSGEDWDTVSGEPQNFWCDAAGTATVEDGTVARMALAGTPLEDERIAELEDALKLAGEALAAISAIAALRWIKEAQR